MMTKQEFLALCESSYPEVAKLDEIKDFYEHEKQFDKIMTELNRALLESNNWITHVHCYFVNLTAQFDGVYPAGLH